MKIFISWSGETSLQLATAIKRWIPDVLQYTTPWISNDIPAGERWSVEVSEKLKSTNFGILCLTPWNKEAPWILFEAGALTKEVNKAKVVPILFAGLNSNELPSPLSQFQAKQPSKTGFYELISDINNWDNSYSIPNEIAKKQFNRCWPELNSEISKILCDSEEFNSFRTIPVLPNINSLISDLAETVSRAIILPYSPEEASVRVSVFEIKSNKLICIHHWSPNQSVEVAGRLYFDINEELAEEIVVVKAVHAQRICRTPVHPVNPEKSGIGGYISKSLSYVIAAPIFSDCNKVWGAWGFDASNDVGEAILREEISDAVMFKVSEQIMNLAKIRDRFI